MRTETKDKVYFYSDNEFINILTKSKSIADAARNIKANRKAEKYIKIRMIDLQVERSIFYKQTKEDKIRFILENMLVDETKFSNSTIKKNILKYKLLEYKCNWCGLTHYWNGKKLHLQLDHFQTCPL